MGILLSSVMLYTRDTYLTQNTLFVTMSLVCGITYPIQYLPDWVQNVAQIFPLTPAVTLFRNVVIGHENLISNHLMIVQILVLSGIYLVLGTCYFFQVSGFFMVVLVVLAIACYAMSLGPITWVLLAEIFPNLSLIHI